MIPTKRLPFICVHKKLRPIWFQWIRSYSTNILALFLERWVISQRNFPGCSGILLRDKMKANSWEKFSLLWVCAIIDSSTLELSYIRLSFTPTLRTSRPACFVHKSVYRVTKINAIGRPRVDRIEGSNPLPLRIVTSVRNPLVGLKSRRP